MAKRRRRSGSCHVANVRFKTKRGKVISFKGHQGADCGPRPKPSTAHLHQHKIAFKQAAAACKRAGKRGRAFGKCIGSKL